MNTELIQKFASDACTVIDACESLIGELYAENEQLKKMSKTASETPAAVAEVKLDNAALMKAASAVHGIYGSPENISVQAIATAWQKKPELMLNVINKFASEISTHNKVSGSGIGKPIAKAASEKKGSERSADELLREKYNF